MNERPVSPTSSSEADASVPPQARNRTELVSDDLRRCEQVIGRGLRVFVDVGRALIEIREKRLYRELGYSRFASYCELEWGLSKPRATQLIQGARATSEVRVLTPDVRPPANARQAYELAQAPPGQRAAVWGAIVEQHEPDQITANVIRLHVNPQQGADPAEPPRPVDDARAARLRRARDGFDFSDVEDACRPVFDALLDAYEACLLAGMDSDDLNDYLYRVYRKWDAGWDAPTSTGRAPG